MLWAPHSINEKWWLDLGGSDALLHLTVLRGALLPLPTAITHRRLFKITCRDFFFFFQLNKFPHSSRLLRGSQAVFWPLLTGCQMEQLVTIHHQRLPETGQRHSSHHPSSLVVTDRLAGITIRWCAFFPPSLSRSRKNGSSTNVCVLACFSAWHKEPLRLWNFNDYNVTNTGDIIESSRHCPICWPPTRHFTSIYPSRYKYRGTEKCLSHSFLILLYVKKSTGNKQLLFSLPWFPENWMLSADLGAEPPSLKSQNCKLRNSFPPAWSLWSWSCSSHRYNYCLIVLFAPLSWYDIAQTELPY